MFLKNYGLDPVWYYTAPGLSYDAALKITGEWFENITDPNTYLMVQNGICGGISMISMCQELPCRDFRWMSDGELENWKNIRCILDVAPMTPE
jgi:hypothetical protein